MLVHRLCGVNTLRPRQNGRHFADDIFKRIFLNENVLISLKISLKFVAKVRINNIPALVQIMAWHRLVDKPLSEPMMVSLLTHICVTRPQWVNCKQKWHKMWSGAIQTAFLSIFSFTENWYNWTPNSSRVPERLESNFIHINFLHKKESVDYWVTDVAYTLHWYHIW